MKKRNLWLVMLALVLVFGMLFVACGGEEGEEEEENTTPTETGPDLEKEETYFGTYTSTYKNGGNSITETIVINEDYFLVYDTKPKSGDTPDTELSGEYLLFSIKDWDKTAKTPDANKADYPYAFKFTGSVTAAKNKNTNNLYGSQTAPGLTAADITGSTLCYMYLYFDYKDGAINFIRTRFNKNTNGDPDNDKVVNWATQGADKDKLRAYTFKSKDSTIDTTRYPN